MSKPINEKALEIIQGARIVSQAEAEDVDFVIAGPYEPGTAMRYPDNLTGPCTQCGTMLQARYHAPRKPWICMACALELSPDGVQGVTTKQTVDEVKKFLES